MDEIQRALAWLEGGAILLDVRTPQEFAVGHARGAVNLPLQELERRGAELGSGLKQRLVLYCQSGRRSAVAARLLKGLGFESVVDVGSLAVLRDAR